ncbi:hypothetical protein DFH09DRAFT_1277457, partial [Mycena vulgaris]
MTKRRKTGPPLFWHQIGVTELPDFVPPISNVRPGPEIRNQEFVSSPCGYALLIVTRHGSCICLCTLFERWSLDKILALATAVYVVDFALTRDRTHETDTFDCTSEHIATDNARGWLEGYEGAVFGTVEAIHFMGPDRGLLVRLGRPLMFEKQMEVLTGLIKIEEPHRPARCLLLGSLLRCTSGCRSFLSLLAVSTFLFRRRGARTR